jgi:hypothetical protein
MIYHAEQQNATWISVLFQLAHMTSIAQQAGSVADPSCALWLQAVSRDTHGKLVAKVTLLSAAKPDAKSFLRMLDTSEELELEGAGGGRAGGESMAGSDSGGCKAACCLLYDCCRMRAATPRLHSAS